MPSTTRSGCRSRRCTKPCSPRAGVDLLYVCDWVLRDIEVEIGRHPPERGGALLGPLHRPLISRFLPDPEAASTPFSYSPSSSLDRRVKQVEAGDGLELKGIVHSHPRSVDRPSDQDAHEL